MGGRVAEGLLRKLLDGFSSIERAAALPEHSCMHRMSQISHHLMQRVEFLITANPTEENDAYKDWGENSNTE